jgi:hypothetical protein
VINRLEELRNRLADKTRTMSLETRVEEFYEALADIVETRSGDPDATVGEYVTEAEFLHVASAYHLTFGDDGRPQDALQA